jgi:hypothetical protein
MTKLRAVSAWVIATEAYIYLLLEAAVAHTGFTFLMYFFRISTFSPFQPKYLRDA